MQVKLKVSRAGVRFAQRPGDVVTVSPAEGARMIAANQAVALPAVETAALQTDTREITKRRRRVRKKGD